MREDIMYMITYPNGTLVMNTQNITEEIASGTGWTELI